MPSTPILILTVDDEHDLCDLTKVSLEMSKDMEVDIACSVQEARNALANKQYDAIVSDYKMPGEDGIQFLKELRASGDRIPFILFTGKGREEVVIEALNNGADFYIQKGGDPTAQYTELAHKVRCAVSRRRGETSLEASVQELREAASRYEALIAASNTGAWEYHTDTGFMWCSPEYFSMLGRDIHDYDLSGARNIEQVWIALLPPENQERAIRTFKDYLNNPDGVYEQYYRRLHKDGHWLWIWSRGKMLRDGCGNPTGIVVGTHIDITERKRAEETLQKSEEKYRLLVNSAAEAIVVIQDGIIRLVNPVTAALTGLSEQELMSKPFSSFIHPDDRAMMVERYQRRSSGEAIPDRYAFRYLTKDESTRWAEINTIVIDWEGRPASLNFLTDITERKRIEVALHEANRKLNLLSNITRHDINNQLMVLKGNLTLLEKKQLDHSSDDHIQKVKAAAERISAMIQFTKEYEDIGVHAAVWQDVRALIDTSAREVTPGSIKVVNDVPDGIEVFVDPMINKVFHNLIDNAVRHGGNVTTIHFSIEDVVGSRAIICEDDGVGISVDMKERIFTQGSGDEHGFGLFLSREILAITGITIAENGKVGQGVRFEMMVPPGGWRHISS